MDGFTANTLPVEIVGAKTIAYGAGLFVVPYGNYVATSPDGQTWTVRALGLSFGEDWSSIIYANGRFVAVSQARFGQSASQVAITSPDGITWTQRTMPTSTEWQDVAFGNGLFLAVSRASGRAATSPDGATWTARTLVNRSWSGVIFGNGRFVIHAGGTSQSNELTHSTDGINFTFSGVSGIYLPVPGYWRGVFANSRFVLVSESHTESLVSFDGLSWTTGTMPGAPATALWNRMAYGDGKFFTASRNLSDTAALPNGSIATSVDGLTWNLIVSSTGNESQGVAYGNARFVGVSSSGGSTKAMVYEPPPPVFWRSFVGSQELP